jgi:hypothetical protein
MASCKDCSVCTMPGMAKLGRSFPMFAWTMLTLGMVRVFSRRCPRCHHRMRRHG